MVETDFYSRFFLIAILGLSFIFVMFKSARRNPSAEQGKHTVAKILGVLRFVLSAVQLFSLFMSFGRIVFPESSLPQPITPHSIIRSSSQHLIWGYPTSDQNMVFISALGFFQLIAFGLYALFFKSSDSTTGMKIWKVILCFLLYFLMPSATDFHYFDTPEIVIPILTVVLLVLYPRVGKAAPMDKIQETKDVTLSEKEKETKEVIYSEENVNL